MARLFATPLARRIAQQEGVDLSSIKGSGPHGRIIQRDVEQAAKQGVGKQAAAPQPAVSGEVERIKLDAMRKTVAKRMTEAKSTVPHFYLTIDCEIDALLAARKRLNEALDAKVSVNDFIIKACALALQQVPAVVAVAVLAHRITVTPDIRRASLACPTARPGTSLMRLRKECLPEDFGRPEAGPDRICQMR